VLLLATHKLVFSQIVIPDSSIENVNSFSSQFFTWNICCNTPDPMDKFGSFGPNYHPAYMQPTEGNYYLHFVGGMYFQDSLNEKLGVKLNCPVISNKKHFFFIDAACISVVDFLPQVTKGNLLVYLGNNQCDSSQLIWISPTLDTFWNRYKIEFLPTSNYQFILLKAFNINLSKIGIIWVDNLSSIYIQDKLGYVTATASQTTIAAGECVQLSSTANTNYDSVTWSNNTHNFYSNQLIPVEVCPTQTTTYRVQLHDACGYNSWDTITIYVNNECNFNLPNLLKVNQPLISASNYLSFAIKIYNSLGELVFKDDTYKNNWQTPTAGLYIANVQCVNGTQKKIKIVVQQ